MSSTLDDQENEGWVSFACRASGLGCLAGAVGVLSVPARRTPPPRWDRRSGFWKTDRLYLAPIRLV